MAVVFLASCARASTAGAKVIPMDQDTTLGFELFRKRPITNAQVLAILYSLPGDMAIQAAGRDGSRCLSPKEAIPRLVTMSSEYTALGYTTMVGVVRDYVHRAELRTMHNIDVAWIQQFYNAARAGVDVRMEGKENLHFILRQSAYLDGILAKTASADKFLTRLYEAW